MILIGKKGKLEEIYIDFVVKLDTGHKIIFKQLGEFSSYYASKRVKIKHNFNTHL